MDHVGTGAALRREVLTARPSEVLRLLPEAMDDGVPAADTQRRAA